MSIAARNAILAGGGGPSPAHYDAEVEFLESTGTQFIDTGIYLTGEDVYIWVDFQYTERRASSIIIGVLQSSPNRACLLNAATNTHYWRCYDAFYSQSLIVSTSRKTQTIEMEGDSVKFYNGTTLQSTKTITNRGASTYPLCMFNGYDDAGLTDRFMVGKFFGAQIGLNSVLVRDFIPVRVGSGSSAVGYMYDRVSGELFGNAGIGAFVIGPDASAANGGGYKRQCVRCSHTRSWRPSARFCSPRLWKEVA